LTKEEKTRQDKILIGSLTGIALFMGFLLFANNNPKLKPQLEKILPADLSSYPRETILNYEYPVKNVWITSDFASSLGYIVQYSDRNKAKLLKNGLISNVEGLNNVDWIHNHIDTEYSEIKEPKLVLEKGKMSSPGYYERFYKLILPQDQKISGLSQKVSVGPPWYPRVEKNMYNLDIQGGGK
jgi:hypothetical protein